MRKIALALAVLMVLACIPVAAETLTSEPGTLPIVTEPVTLTVWTQEVANRDYETCPNTVNYEEMTGVHIDWHLVGAGEDATTAFNLSITGGDLPDIYARSFSTSDVLMCVEGNVLLPLNDLIESDGVYYKQALEEQPNYKGMLTAPDGNIYTFMYTDTGVHKDSEYKMWVKASWLDTLGKDMPTTPEEFKDLLIAIRDNDVNGNGDATDEIPLVGHYNGRQTDPIAFLMNPFQLYRDNYYYITDDGQVQFTANTDGWRDGLRYLADLFAEGLIDEQTYVQDGTQFRAMLNKPSDEAIVGTFPGWYQGDYIDTKVLDWTDYVAVPPLEGPTGLRQTAARQGGNFQLNGAITTACENPTVAFRWLDWMLSEEGTYFGHYGKEGENWKWVDAPSYYGDERSVERITTDLETLWNSSTFPRYDRASIRYATTQNPDLYTTDNTYVLLSAAQAYEPYYVWHNIPDIVWCSDNDLQTERADLQTLFNEYIVTMDTQFVMGEIDINDDAEWEAYKAELDSMGLDHYIEVLTSYFMG